MEESITRRKFIKNSVLAGTGVALGMNAVPTKLTAKKSSVLRLPVRYYQIAQLYGPGMPPSGKEGLHERVFEKPTKQVGLVLGHVWNLGEADAPYPIGPDAHRPGEASNWVPVAHEIIKNKIKPALEAARKANIEIFHLAQSGYANKYPQYHEIASDPELNPEDNVSYKQCVRPRSTDEMWNDEYGANFPGPVWVTHHDKFDIAKEARPLPNEAVFLTGYQLNGLCRRKDIDTLFYIGFMADICLLDVPGALREMANKFRYRCVALRDCTTAYEYEETYENNWMTYAVIRRIEQDMGYTASSADFVAACQQAMKDS